LVLGEPKKVVQGQYIVVLHSNLTVADRDEHISNLNAHSAAAGAVSEVSWVYNIGSLIGFSAKLDATSLRTELAHPDVDYIEEDQIVTLNYEMAPEATITQTGAVWGLSRIDEHTRSTSLNYVYNSNAGQGVEVFVVDTGVYTAHSEFGGRASMVFNAITGEASNDLNGHGTHCAGTIGGTIYGVAKKATIKGVKVLSGSGSGTNAGVIAGVDYVANNRVSGKPTVASMSLGGGPSTALDTAVANTIKLGILFAIAAGNDNANACNYSPARVPAAITVGATTSTDARSSFSNYGTCLDIFAPGTNIQSAWIGSTTATSTISGTSMATPHVAGVLAVQLSLNPSYTDALLASEATANMVTSPGTGSVNKLLYSKV